MFRNIYSSMGYQADPNGEPPDTEKRPYDPRTGQPYAPPIPQPHPAPASAPPPAVDSSPSATMTGGVTPSAESGPSGIGGSGGYGFVNMASYLNANPMGSGPGSGYAPVPTGMTGADFNPGVHGFAPAGQYTPGMAAEDNMLNTAYGRNSVPSDQPPATANGGPPPGEGGGHGTGNEGGAGEGGGGGGGGGGPADGHGRGPNRTLVDDYTNPKSRDGYGGGYGNIRSSMRTQGY